MERLIAHLRPIYPRGWPEANAISKRVDKNEGDAEVVCRTIAVIRICKREHGIDLDGTVSSAASLHPCKASSGDQPAWKRPSESSQQSA